MSMRFGIPPTSGSRFLERIPIPSFIKGTISHRFEHLAERIGIIVPWEVASDKSDPAEIQTYPMGHTASG
jgi:hypothetical protein